MTKLAYITGPLLLGALWLGACSDDSDDGDGNGGSAGSSGMAGSAGAAGSGGDAGSGGSAGSSGMAGSAGSTMAGGSAGMAGSAGSGMTASAEMSFFVTSEGSGDDGADLGGLSGADARCQELADAAGSDKTWRAYLSTSGADGEDARDRIGDGPWYNFMGQEIAEDVDELHGGIVFNGDPQLILDENGTPAPANEHDILTGSDEDGTALGDNCENFTSNSADLTEQPQVGHSDIPANPDFSPSWNSAHTAANCSATGLTMRGGAGRLYCFAID